MSTHGASLSSLTSSWISPQTLQVFSNWPCFTSCAPCYRDLLPTVRISSTEIAMIRLGFPVASILGYRLIELGRLGVTYILALACQLDEAHHTRTIHPASSAVHLHRARLFAES